MGRAGEKGEGRLSGLSLLSTALSGLKRDLMHDPSDLHPDLRSNEQQPERQGVDEDSAADTKQLSSPPNSGIESNHHHTLMRRARYCKSFVRSRFDCTVNFHIKFHKMHQCTTTYKPPHSTGCNTSNNM
jgi:hypothetical protein